MPIIFQLTLALDFQYLGSVEVFDSRGMQVCEEAIKVLKVKQCNQSNFIFKDR